MSVLDISKVCLYEFHYDYMLKNVFDCKLNYVDTDSLTYEIHNQDPYELIRRDCTERFDTSDFPLNNIYGISQVNEKVLGVMKDENNVLIMNEFVGLRSKMYSFRVDDREIHEIKGIRKSCMKTITFDDYKTCSFHSRTEVFKQKNITSRYHYIFSVEQTKLALSNSDNKRFILIIYQLYRYFTMGTLFA